MKTTHDLKVACIQVTCTQVACTEFCAGAEQAQICCFTQRATQSLHRRRIGWCGALALWVLTAVATLGAQNVESGWAGLGHGKRYMRINEYLFNGTQKVTAIARLDGVYVPDKTPT
jgi:hypothetical protein